MRYSNVCIESIGYELPKQVVTSAEIEARLAPLYDRLQLPYGRLEMMSGIRERRFWDDGWLCKLIMLALVDALRWCGYWKSCA
jgi:3-oxoacyl-[acyl-carrier-protein] synthase III